MPVSYQGSGMGRPAGGYDVPRWQTETWVTAGALLGAVGAASVASRRRRRHDGSAFDAGRAAGQGPASWDGWVDDTRGSEDEPWYGDAPASSGYAEPGWVARVSLLSPPGAVNRAGEYFDAPSAGERTLEVLAWLATHRGYPRADLEAAVWGIGDHADAVTDQLVLARRVLVALAGDHPDGWITSDGPLLHLDSRVVTDFDLLHRRLAHALAHRDEPETVIPVLAEGLSLVGTGRGIHPWSRAELDPAITSTAISAATLLAECHLDCADPAGALAATARGLALDPAHPGLVALRMHAHAYTGDAAGLAGEYRSYRAAEQSSPHWSGQPNRALEQLYYELAGDLPATLGT
ncbi:bacterial transcriptional activator domain-containing protein [Frankia sp. CN6]|uniref:Bacterial transcriptional activator domain-containing protein n=2 Tax=Frankia nepalensis TaxID=1836974 RepID=A0A937RKC8_9ACTN|nr:bacterial transcriptional activator domain-containing protein [Frankia nepalensis]MBL7631872.1 bacterial transcriptional activator domain-containing protein [Frankia nepalensis]